MRDPFLQRRLVKERCRTQAKHRHAQKGIWIYSILGCCCLVGGVDSSTEQVVTMVIVMKTENAKFMIIVLGLDGRLI